MAKFKSRLHIVAVILMFFLLIAWQIPAFTPLYAIEPISFWEISRENESDATILWQREVPCLTPSIISPHGTIAVSTDFVFFHRTCGLAGKLVALHLQSGEQAWEIPSPYAYHVDYANDIFFAIEGDSYISGITTEGNRLWRSTKFLSRSVRYMYPVNNQIHVPRSNNTQIMSIDSGEIIDELDLANILSTNDQYVVQRLDNRIQITDLSAQSSVVTNPVPNSEYDLTHTYAQIYETLALIYFGHSEIYAVELATGDLLWHKNGDWGSVPLLHNELLYVYSSDNSLMMYRPQDGSFVGEVFFQYDTLNQSQTGVALAASSNIFVLAYPNTGELLTVEINIESQAQR